VKLLVRLVAFAIYMGCIVGANWALERYGFVPLFGVDSIVVPAGVYFAGLALVARDALREVATRTEVGLAIFAGAALSYAIEPAFAVASGVAFLVSEFADAAVYEPFRAKHWASGVWASQIVGSVIDSVLFLSIAFSFGAARSGWFDLTVGKAAMALFGLPLVWGARHMRSRVA
jgi:uncharacterized PurR-regulated membrane protein YhhQ (DUF165 family)